MRDLGCSIHVTVGSPRLAFWPDAVRGAKGHQGAPLYTKGQQGTARGGMEWLKVARGGEGKLRVEKGGWGRARVPEGGQGRPMGNRTNAVKFRHILREFSKTRGHEVYKNGLHEILANRAWKGRAE